MSPTDKPQKRRRGHGEGSIYQRSDGLWIASVNLGHVNGKRKRLYLSGKTRKEVAEKLKVALRDQQQGHSLIPERQTVDQFLTRWLADVVAPNHRPKTYHNYDQAVRLYFRPTIGGVALSKLTGQQVQAMLSGLQVSGLAPGTIRTVRNILRAALSQAVKWELVPRNVASLVELPPLPDTKAKALTVAQAQQLFAAARGDRLEALYRVALALGLRRSEVLGLRWQDVDLEQQTLTIAFALQDDRGSYQLVEPKTRNSRRTLPLPPMLIAALRAHKIRQYEERLLAGSRWQEHGLVFPTSLGTPQSPRNLLRSFHRLLKRADLPHMRFHDLRHSCLSLLAAQGVPPRVAMEIAGHSNINITLQVYTHVLDGALRSALDGMGSVLDQEETEEMAAKKAAHEPRDAGAL